MRILLIFDPNRKDLFSYFSKDKSNDYYLLFYDQKKDQLHPDLNFIQEEFGWADYDTPFEVLQKIKPDRIVFQEIFDIKQIPLNIAAKKFGISTFFLDHGIWSDIDEILTEDGRGSGKIRSSKIKKLKKISRILKSYFFYYSALKAVKFESMANFLIFPFYAFFTSPVKAIHKLSFDERKPDKFIIFAPYNFEPIKSYYHFNDNEVTFSGIPYFDSFYNTNLVEEDYIVFIDHPYLEDGILEWDAGFHERLASTLLKLAEKAKLKIYVKLHPRSNLNIWQAYNLPSEKIELVKNIQDNKFYTNSRLIIGYASTLMIGFISAKKNVVLVGWNPTPSIFGPDFSKYEMCHKSLNIQDASKDYDYWISHNFTNFNKTAYENFLNIFNPHFDGNASERIIKTIVGKEIS